MRQAGTTTLMKVNEGGTYDHHIGSPTSKTLTLDMTTQWRELSTVTSSTCEEARPCRRVPLLVRQYAERCLRSVVLGVELDCTHRPNARKGNPATLALDYQDQPRWTYFFRFESFVLTGWFTHLKKYLFGLREVSDR